MYSTVVKVKPSHKKRRTSSLEDISSSSSPCTSTDREATVFENKGRGLASRSTPEILANLPKLDCYEPPVEPTIIIINPSVATNQIPQVVSHESQVTSGDPTYDTIDAPWAWEEGEGETTEYTEVDMPKYDASVYKNLKKHDDKGNVHLVSIKGISEVPQGGQGSSMSLPPGNSQDMQPIHYAAAAGNKKLLSEILSNLPVSQDPVEMVLGTDRLCKREGVDVNDSEGRTALLHAVHNDQLQSVKMLAEAGANINAATNGTLLLTRTCTHTHTRG